MSAATTHLKSKSASVDMPPVRCARQGLDEMIALGFDSFEIYIPYGEDRPYKLVLWNCDDQWKALVVDTMADEVTVAEGKAATVPQAIWNMTAEKLGNYPWNGDVSLIPVRLMLFAAILWEDVTEAAAQKDADAVTAALAEAAESRLNHARAGAARDVLFEAAPDGSW